MGRRGVSGHWVRMPPEIYFFFVSYWLLIFLCVPEQNTNTVSYYKKKKIHTRACKRKTIDSTNKSYGVYLPSF